jgi:hypothetical protein
MWQVIDEQVSTSWSFCGLLPPLLVLLLLLLLMLVALSSPLLGSLLTAARPLSLSLSLQVVAVVYSVHDV